MPTSTKYRTTNSTRNLDSQIDSQIASFAYDAQNASESPSASLPKHIEMVVREYFDNLKEQQPTQLYELMLLQFEKPLINVVLEYTRGNQTRTAEILGLNRGTLRKKLKTHQLL